MKKFLVVLLSCCVAMAQTPEVDVVNNLKSEIVTKNLNDSANLLSILEKYFNDGCTIKVNSEQIILKKKRFKQYAEIGSTFFQNIQKNFDLEIKEIVSEGTKQKLKSILKISEKQQVKIDFVLEKGKFSEVDCKNVPLSASKKLILRGIFNLLQ